MKNFFLTSCFKFIRFTNLLLKCIKSCNVKEQKNKLEQKKSTDSEAESMKKQKRGK